MYITSLLLNCIIESCLALGKSIILLLVVGSSGLAVAVVFLFPVVAAVVPFLSSTTAGRCCRRHATTSYLDTALARNTIQIKVAHFAFYRCPI